MQTFPNLYKKDSKGKLQIWKMEVLGDDVRHTYGVLRTMFGKVDGKMQVNEERIEQGKNLGKLNATTPYTQTLAEAQSRWTKQIERKGYVEDINKVNTDMREGAEPMLAHRYDKYAHKITYPCLAQPKLDGHRCLAIVNDGICKLFSRQRKPITGVPHINKVVGDLGIKNIILDGELYQHDYKDKFEELTGFIRSEEPKEGYEVVQYHIYDVVNDKPYGERTDILSRILPLHSPTNTLQYVLTQLVETEEQMLQIFRKHRNNGYEGAILRNTKGLYVGKRSYDLQKVKEFDDAEFRILGVKEGRGKLKGHAIFECEVSPLGAVFDVKMKGALEKLQEIYQNREKYVGKKLTVAYQGLTKNGIPRFPVGLRLRDDE